MPPQTTSNPIVLPSVTPEQIKAAQQKAQIPAPQPIQQPSNQPSPQGSSGLDPQLVNLAKAIRQTESGGNFTAKGKSGEYGAYQFTEPTWQKQSASFGITTPLQQATPDQQNEVAYKQLESWKKQHPDWNIGNYASAWNAGEGKPNAYIDGNKGVNKEGVPYDTGAYAKSVATAYQKIKQGQQVGADPNNPSSTAAKEPNFLDKLFSGDLTGAGKDAVNWAFPIIGDVAGDIHGDNQKTALQQLGDAGLSALWFVPGLGEGSGVLAHALEGGALGYGAGALSSLSQGKGLGESLVPNASNLLGAATGGIAGGVLSKASSFLGKNLSQQGALQSLEDNLETGMRGTKSGSKFVDASVKSGFDPAKLLAQSQAIPDVVDGKFVTAPAEDIMRKRISQLGETRATALDKMGSSVPIEDLRTEALRKVQGLAATGETGKMSSQINKIFDDFNSNYGEKLTPTQLEAIKEAQAGASGIYKRTGQIGEQNAASIIGDVSRSKIESLADEAGFPGMKEYNKYIKQHYNALDALNKINGQTVKGGRLGNILRGHTIAGASALGASAMGGGLIGTLGAAAMGEGANGILSKILGDTSFTNPLRDAILGKIKTENPEIVEKLMNFAQQKGGKVAPLLAPKASKVSGLLPNLLTKTSARSGASLSN